MPRKETSRPSGGQRPATIEQHGQQQKCGGEDGDLRTDMMVVTTNCGKKARRRRASWDWSRRPAAPGWNIFRADLVPARFWSGPRVVPATEPRRDRRDRRPRSSGSIRTGAQGSEELRHAERRQAQLHNPWRRSSPPPSRSIADTGGDAVRHDQGDIGTRISIRMVTARTKRREMHIDHRPLLELATDLAGGAYASIWPRYACWTFDCPAGFWRTRQHHLVVADPAKHLPDRDGGCAEILRRDAAVRPKSLLDIKWSAAYLARWRRRRLPARSVAIPGRVDDRYASLRRLRPCGDHPDADPGPCALIVANSVTSGVRYGFLTVAGRAPPWLCSWA